MAFLITLFAIHSGRWAGRGRCPVRSAPLRRSSGTWPWPSCSRWASRCRCTWWCNGSASRSSGGPGGGGPTQPPRPAAAACAHRGAPAAVLAAALRDAVAGGAVVDPGRARRGVRLGLPVAAIIAATVPVWGMSWYFDTENWAAGIWNSWAEARTDTWREAMVRAVSARSRSARRQARLRRRRPPGVATRRLLLHRHRRHRRGRRVAARPARPAARRRPRARTSSSSSSRPTWSIRPARCATTRAKFWLPFKGVTKPVYAIPGNHDWYDALEGFAATFLEPAAARAAMRARVEADLRSSAPRRRTHRAADRPRPRGCGGSTACPTGFQRAPFFQVQTERFALIAVDTGVARRVDPAQDALAGGGAGAARGKFDDGDPRPPVLRRRLRTSADRRRGLRAALRACCASTASPIVMAGDTHDLEYYAEPADAAALRRCTTSSTAAAARISASAPRWPGPPSPRTADWAYYPAHGAGRRQDRSDDAVVEAARVVVDDAASAPGRSRAEWLSARLRLQRGAVLPELRRGPRRSRTASSCGPTACTVGCAGATSIARRPRRPSTIGGAGRFRRVVVPPTSGPLNSYRRGPTKGQPQAYRRPEASTDRIPSRVLGAPHLRGRVVRGHRAVDLGGRRRAQPAVRTRRLRVLLAHAERRPLVPDDGAPCAGTGGRGADHHRSGSLPVGRQHWPAVGDLRERIRADRVGGPQRRARRAVGGAGDLDRRSADQQFPRPHLVGHQADRRVVGAGAGVSHGPLLLGQRRLHLRDDGDRHLDAGDRRAHVSAALSPRYWAIVIGTLLPLSGNLLYITRLRAAEGSTSRPSPLRCRGCASRGGFITTGSSGSSPWPATWW